MCIRDSLDTHTHTHLFNYSSHLGVFPPSSFIVKDQFIGPSSFIGPILKRNNYQIYGIFEERHIVQLMEAKRSG